MSLSVIRYGRYTTAVEADWGQQSSGQMRATVYDQSSNNMWVTKIGGWVGKDTGSNATVRWALYETDSSKNPTTQVGYTDAATVSAAMSSGVGGASYTPDIDGDPLMILSGRRYCIAALPTAASIEFSMRQASAISADNEQLYSRTGLSQPPPDPFGSYTSSIEGHQSYWAEGYRNARPETPSNNLYPTGTITETAPVFTADFDDLNGSYGTANGGADTGDVLNQYKIQVREVGTTTLLWNATYTATLAEKAADAVSRTYGGSTLTRGDTYEWRIWMSDQFSDISSYSEWTQFTPASLGFVTLDSDPTGKIEDTTPDFKGRWNHQSAADMTRVQVRLKSSTGVVLQTGEDYNIADVVSASLPGTLFTVPWANTGFTELAWGTSYRYEIRGKDASVWSDWSAYRTFQTNKAPSIASNHSPATGAIVSAYPKLTFALTDADDTVATGLQAWTDVTDESLTVFHFEATYNATTGLWESQLTATEVTTEGTYGWAAYGYDGTIYSGEAASAGAAFLAATTRTFIYAIGPSVTVTAPADLDTITAASLTVTWTVSDQVKYQVIVYEDGTSTIVYDSGLVVSATASHDIPSGYLRNLTNYDIVVSITDSTPLVGSSSIVNIDVDYTPADPVLNFQVLPAQIGLDPWPTAVRLTWDMTDYESPEFQEYTIFRSANGGPDAAEIILARITSPATVEYVDYTPASGYEYEYGITVTIVTGLDSLESDRVSDVATVTLQGVVLTLVGNGGTYRSCLSQVRERSFDRQNQETVYLIGETPITVRGEPRFWTGEYEGVLTSDTDATARQRWDELDALDAEIGAVCIRDDWQSKRFAKIVNLNKVDETAGYIRFAFSVRDELASEGEA
jgi:hypothetical protein